MSKVSLDVWIQLIGMLGVIVALNADCLKVNPIQKYAL